MNQTELEKILIDAVRELQIKSGRPDLPVTSDTRPVLDLPDFDSLNAVEVTITVQEKLKVEFKINNIFVEHDKALTIKQVATRILNHIGKN